MRIQFFIPVFILFLMACNSGENPGQRKISLYFDLEGLVKDQLVLLDSLNPVVNKKTVIDGIEESDQLKMDSISWARELEIFIQSDINKPVLQDSYAISETEEGNQKIKIFEAKNKEKLGVEYLKIYYDGDILKKVESLYKEKNTLYNSQRKMIMNFEAKADDIPILASYTVEGKQKMILKDSIYFEVRASLSY